MFFSALGEIADRDILEKIVYDFEDEDMLQVKILFRFQFSRFF